MVQCPIRSLEIISFQSGRFLALFLFLRALLPTTALTQALAADMDITPRAFISPPPATTGQ